ncbi:MAG: serine hydrolase [Bacteroidales bacterium]|jgi:beta-glucosidase-like glycosyl hydrolase/CubicO group peptidase (beta-lactamase class C family)|nr:serine hydrolase [Bacteroidales bacterium]
MIKYLRKFWDKLFLVVTLSLIFNTPPKTVCSFSVPFLSIEQNRPSVSWADSVLRTLSLDEKIAQLLMLRGHSNKDNKYNQELIKTVSTHQVGGICFFQGGVVREAILTNQLQSVSRIPLMIAMDAEWGLAMRLDSVDKFPRQMALGAGNDTAAIYQMGKEIAAQCKRLGIHCNFAPCVDINSNPRNPVINSRSFGADVATTTHCAMAYMKGMQDNGIMACIKHFPGHGDTETDSHYSLPTINKSVTQLKNTELHPFKALIEQNVDAVMVGHLNIPAIDEAINSIASTSYKITTELLKKQMHFKGLVFTDGLEMKGIADYYPAGELEVRALEAGCDVLLLPHEPQLVIDSIKKAIAEGRLSENDINEKCLKVLKMKEKYVLPNCGIIATEHLLEDINSKKANELNQLLTKESITLLSNSGALIPLLQNPTAKIAHLRADKNGGNTFQNTLNQQIKVNTFTSKSSFADDAQKSFEFVKDADYVIVSLHSLSQYPKNDYNLLPATVKFLDSLTQIKPVILALMSNPFCLDYMPFSDRFAGIVVAYHPTSVAEKYAAEAILGNFIPKGKLPVEINNYPCKSGIIIPQWQYITLLENAKRYSAPPRDATEQSMLAREDADILPKENWEDIIHFYSQKKINKLTQKIDSLALAGLSIGAYSGCQVRVLYKNRVLYNHSFGTIGINDTTKVTDSTLFDVASITKVAATTLSMMKLYEDKQIKLTTPIGEYLPQLKGTDKENLTIAQLMTHTAGLQAWIPFYKSTLIPTGLNPDLYRFSPQEGFTTQVAQNLYIKDDYIPQIYSQIYKSALRKNKNYLYSDLGFYLLAEIVEKITQQPVNEYVMQNFYQPMNLRHILYNPLQKFDLQSIAATENDTFFRQMLIHGYVHDPGAAMLGGVAGHAGLFANASDLAAIGQMLSERGEYKGKDYFSRSTVKTFTSYYYPDGSECRRSLGFDKPARKNGANPCSKYASPQSFGHSGFTGTLIWIDPKYDLVYVFLSNRLNISHNNPQLLQSGIRTKIQDAVYQYILGEN